MIGEQLYGLNLKEAVSAPVIGRPLMSQTVVLANATVQTTDLMIVPDDQILLLQDFCFVAQGGGGQTVTTMVLRIWADTNLVVPVHFLENTAGLAVASRTIARSLSNCLVMPGELVHAIATFNAGVAANTIVVSLIGLMLPRGNLQFR